MPEMALDLADALHSLDPALVLLLRVAVGLLIAGAVAILVACTSLVLAHCCGLSRSVPEVH